MHDWYDEEEPVHIGLVAELQRIRRRTVARPWPVFALALVITAAISYRIATHKAPVDAEVVLALSEGAMSGHSSGLPVESLKSYVTDALMPDAKLGELIERHDLFHLRHKLGMQFAIEQLREQFEVDVWKNTFMTDYSAASHSARIGITVTDTDPDRAYAVARDLAAIVIATANDQRGKQTKTLADKITARRDQLEQRLAELERETSQKEYERAVAHNAGREDRAVALDLELVRLRDEQKSRSAALTLLVNSRDATADQIEAAGLDVTIDIVDEHRPPPSDHRSFVLAMAIVIVGFSAAIGSALLVGAFDARVHDTDDVERLGLTVLGHLPSFPGDQVGSLEARGAVRRRVPSFSRWRWLR